MSDTHQAELDNIRERYARRAGGAITALYDPLAPVNLSFRHERERAMVAMVRQLCKNRQLSSLRILEIGCGSGRNLADFIGWGAKAENCVGNELLAERVEAARANVPPGATIVRGDASALDFADCHFDIILQSTVFSSILDRDLRSDLAANMWRMLAPNGGVLWYDFTVDNPKNPDVVGIPQSQVRALFPNANYHAQKVTLAPPIARRAVRLSPALYPALNALPFLRTHIMALLRKAPDVQLGGGSRSMAST